VVWGMAQPKLRNPWNAVLGGVGIVARPGVRLITVHPADGMEKRLWETRRFVHAVAAIRDGKEVVHILNVFGHTASASNAEEAAQKQKALGRCF